jgi:hypothetical protein
LRKEDEEEVRWELIGKWSIKIIDYFMFVAALWFVWFLASRWYLRELFRGLAALSSLVSNDLPGVMIFIFVFCFYFLARWLYKRGYKKMAWALGGMSSLPAVGIVALVALGTIMKW